MRPSSRRYGRVIPLLFIRLLDSSAYELFTKSFAENWRTTAAGSKRSSASPSTRSSWSVPYPPTPHARTSTFRSAAIRAQ